jgi:hypothetical protein
LVGSFLYDGCKITSNLTNTEEQMMRLRDPLFVIGTSLEIIKQRSQDDKIKPELKRIEDALTKIVQIMQ